MGQPTFRMSCMAIHNDLPSMSREVIEEYLAIANYCVATRKSDGGVYGYPAVLLLLCVVDALSNYAGNSENSFLAMKDVMPSLSEEQIKSLASWYRHLPAHQAIIMPGTKLTVDDAGAAIELNSEGEPTHIRVKPLYEAVKAAWDRINPTEIRPRYRQEKAPKQPIVTNVSPVSASGTFVISKTSSVPLIATLTRKKDH